MLGVTTWRSLKFSWSLHSLLTNTCSRLNHLCVANTVFGSNWSAPSVVYQNLTQKNRCFSGTTTARGFEEFFPTTNNPVEEGEQSGRPWLARELRHKGSEDLHKLWYVLLKERNMLLTVKQEANRELFVMPGPERARKVRRSMARIKVVLFERERALKEARRILKGDTETQTMESKSTSTSDTKRIRKRPYNIRKLLDKKRIKPIRNDRLQTFTKPRRSNVHPKKHLKAAAAIKD